MPLGVIQAIVALSAIAIFVREARALLRPAGELGLTIFRPYRSDTWPRGVQEDDEVRFDWSRREAAPPDPDDEVAIEPIEGHVRIARH